MGFWARVFGTEGITPNDNDPSSVGEPGWNPGDPDGLEVNLSDDVENRSLPVPFASPWSGWPADWQTPNWQSSTISGIRKLVDIAWACLDLNSRVLSSMPAYRLRDGKIIPPRTWMTNPDPLIYSSWHEFVKQLFWDYQLGEAFVMPMSTGSDNYPLTFRVIPPWLMDVDFKDGTRVYKLGNRDVTDEILHLRYHSNTADARGHGPLEVAGARFTTIALLQRYVHNIAESGGVPLYWMELTRQISASEGRDILARWIESRAKYAGQPALVANGAKLNQSKPMSAHDMALMEITQFDESRIAVLTGVPPFLVGLSGAAGSLTYSNVESLFDFHDRSSLRPMASAVMGGFSEWALPYGQTIELNRDDYTRPSLDKRVTAYQTLFNIVDEATGERAITIAEIRAMERFRGESAAGALTGVNAALNGGIE